MLPMDTLVNVAVFSDKYDMSRVLRTWSSIWLERGFESASQEDLAKMLQAASSFVWQRLSTKPPG